MKYINKRLKNYTAEKDNFVEWFTVKSNGETYSIPAELIIDSPDWQLKPSFEITAFRDSLSGHIAKLNDGVYKYPSGMYWSLDNMLNAIKNNNGIEIFSVIREDGIEFSLQQKTEQGEIEKFVIDDLTKGGMLVMLKNGNGINIVDLTPAKKVILTTFDGVDVTDLETMLWGVYNFELDKRPYEAATFKNEFAAKTFSTRELAEDYINKNKPKYSENQIREAYDALFGDFTVTDLIHKLNEKK